MLIGIWLVKMALVRVHRGKDSMRNWTRACQSYIMEKHIPIFCSCPEILWEDELNSVGLIYLA
jgi:hypothetical protein